MREFKPLKPIRTPWKMIMSFIKYFNQLAAYIQEKQCAVNSDYVCIYLSSNYLKN